MRILAHYQQLSMWRLPPTQRTSIAPRVWIDQKEIQDVAAAFPGVTLSPDQAFDISGATGVPMMLELASNQPWRGHVPGPHGSPGGYPVRSEEHTSELQSLMRISYAVFCLNKNKYHTANTYQA